MTEVAVMEDMEKASSRRPGKTSLCVDIARREMELLEPLNCESGYSLYVGIPFCPTTCLYCSFTSYPISQVEGQDRTAIWRPCYQELEYTAKKMRGTPAGYGLFRRRHAHVPGGRADGFDDLCKLERHRLTVCPAPWSSPWRPDGRTASPEEKLQVLRDHGITRISINPQTMNQSTLDLIGRRHTVEMVKERYSHGPGDGI